MNKNKYYKKYWLSTIDRIHPLKEEQEVNHKLRLHRAERLYPFPDEFFNNFLKTINQEDFRYYPDVHKLKDKLANIYNTKSSNIFLNNGSSENIKTFYDSFAIEGKNVIITNPCYPMHRIYAELQRTIFTKIDYNDNIQINYLDILNKIDENTCCIVLANPNSPIGDIISFHNIEKIICKANTFDIPILIDEAYIEYSNQQSCVDLLPKYPNLIISRTFSKALGCAGLRIGYLIGNNDIMEIINKFIPTYEISSIAAKFGLYLLNNKHIVDDYVELVKNEKIKIGKICNNNNIPCILNHINTIHIKPHNMSEIKEYLNYQPIFYRTRKLPYDEEEWLAIVLYPDFTKSQLFDNLLNISNK